MVASRPTLPRYRSAIRNQERCIITTAVSKHRIFLWIEPPALADHALIVFLRSDDYFFGVLHSKPHEIWSRSQGTQVRERESGFRYTPKACFETFPFPDPTDGQKTAIAEAARRLDEMRNNSLRPANLLRSQVVEFPGSINGPWARFVHDPDHRDIGTVRYPRLVPKDAHVFDLAKRTLTNLYNERPDLAGSRSQGPR